MTITGIAHRQIGTHLRIPAAYYDRMREERPDLLAYNANTWFKQENSQRTSDADAMPVLATGESIPTAMAAAENDAVTDSPIPATPLALEGDSTVDVSPTRDSEIALRAGGSAIVEQTTIPTSSSIQQAAMNRVLLGQMGNSVTDVEIGGGKIQGREIIPGRGQIQFAMYNAHQYEKPEGHFTEQTSRDGEKWYKVYATTRVEKTPTVQDERGRMQYDERKVAAMPKAPARRH